MPDSLATFFRYPGTYVSELTFDCAASFVSGFNVASEGETLASFREWLIVKVDWGNNMGWTALFLRYAFPDSDILQASKLPRAEHDKLIALLADTLTMFLAERDRDEGLVRILDRHSEWLKAQCWHH